MARARFTLIVLLVGSIGAAGCSMHRVGNNSGDAGADAPPGDPVEIRVLTQNLYLGASLAPLLSVTSLADAPDAVAEIWQTVQQTDFPTRAKAIAAQVEATEPDLLALQEVTLYRTQSPSDFFSGNFAPNATNVALDFLQILQSELAARGLAYEVISVRQNADLELPATDGGSLTDIRLTDRDILLATSRVTQQASGSEGFATNYTASIPGTPGVSFERGYAWAQVGVEGQRFVVVDTHLEVGGDPALEAVQSGQVHELIDRFGNESLPVVLAGDFNTAPGQDPYQLLSGSFEDAFASAGTGDGFTCCQAEDLMNATSQLAARIDLVTFDGAVQALSTDRVAEDPADRISDLWPSDHAGVVADLRVGN